MTSQSFREKPRRSSWKAPASTGSLELGSFLVLLLHHLPQGTKLWFLLLTTGCLHATAQKAAQGPPLLSPSWLWLILAATLVDLLLGARGLPPPIHTPAPLGAAEWPRTAVALTQDPILQIPG